MTQRTHDAMIAIREASSQADAMTAALAFAQDMFEAGVQTGRSSNEGNDWTSEVPKVDGFYWHRPIGDKRARMVLLFSYKGWRDALLIDEDSDTESWSLDNLIAEGPCEWKAVRP